MAFLILLLLSVASLAAAQSVISTVQFDRTACLEAEAAYVASLSNSIEAAASQGVDSVLSNITAGFLTTGLDGALAG
jgi:hypothetical protein